MTCSISGRSEFNETESAVSKNKPHWVASWKWQVQARKDFRQGVFDLLKVAGRQTL